MEETRAFYEHTDSDGKPQAWGHTVELCKPLMGELERLGAGVCYLTLADKKIQPCRGCYACQDVAGEYGCVQKDDMEAVVERIRWADCLMLATPIYSWYCPAPMKAVLDRHYGLNKFYGSAEGSLWAGKSVAILATHGYDRAYATEPFETGVRRLCVHSGLSYLGLYSVRDEDNLASFRTAEAQEGARLFARRLMASMEARNQLRGAAGPGGKAHGLPREAEEEGVRPLLSGGKAGAGKSIYGAGAGTGAAAMAHLFRPCHPATGAVRQLLSGQGSAGEGLPPDGATAGSPGARHLRLAGFRRTGFPGNRHGRP